MHAEKDVKAVFLPRKTRIKTGDHGKGKANAMFFDFLSVFNEPD